MKFRRFSVQLLAMIMFAVLPAVPAMALGTASGTVITSQATIDADNAATATVSSPVDVTVGPVYGIDAADFIDPVDGTAAAGGTTDYQFRIQNNGNASDTIRINVGAFTFGAGAGTTTDWNVMVDDTTPLFDGNELTWATSASTTANPGGDTALGSSQIAADAYSTFTVRVTAASDAADQATMSFPVSFQTLNTPAGSYTGENGTNYAGPVTVTRAAGSVTASYLTTDISGVVLSLTKSATSTAPASYVSNGGNAADYVPGTKITYTITYGNTGSLAANNVIIQDTIPTNTTYDAGSINSSVYGALSDAADADECEFTGTAVYCTLGTLGAGSTGNTITFDVTID